jgi:hypothetical protein
MALDLYHRVLQNLFEATEGKSSKTVDFKNLVKQLGFHGNYGDIFQRLSGEGWIVESPKADFVSITHWGVAEVKKSASNAAASGADINAEAKRETNRASSAAKELTALLEDFARSLDKNGFSPIQKKLDELENAIAQIKKNLN